jgi:hypothetical protein
VKLTPEIEAKIIEAIREHEGVPLVLPDWAHWKGRDQPVVSVDRLREQLSRHLYRKLIGPLEDDQMLVQQPGVPARNINPHLFRVATRRQVRTHCPNGHEYAAQRPMDGLARRRCRICYEAYLARRRVAQRRPSAADVNRAKTHCIHGHELAGDNLTVLADGRLPSRLASSPNLLTRIGSGVH